MRTHYLQHATFEGLGSIEPWLKAARHEITNTKFFESAELPDLKKIDLLVVVGGPMSVNDEADYPWLIDEKKWIQQAIDAGKATLGICLGAQLIADVLGAKVYCHSRKEIGWFPVTAIEHQSRQIFQFSDNFKAFHWHGETFDLPEGAIQLASSQACKHQAFQWGRSVLALQFHLEMTVEAVKTIVEHCRSELIADDFVQEEAQILSASRADYQALNQQMDKLLVWLHEMAKDGPQG